MARPGYSLATKGGGGSVKTILLTLSQPMALVAYIAGSLKFTMPETGKLIGVTLNVTAGGGTHVTSTVDVLEGATSLLTAVFDVAAAVAAPGVPINKEGSALSAAADTVAKDAVISVTVAEAGGTNPTTRGLTVQIDYVPLGD
jgi:hypothetical protein